MPTEIDQHVGWRIRELRRIAKCSQAALADSLGITAQQIQKYERGANRVSAGVLWQIGVILNAPITAFFPLDKPSGEPEPPLALADDLPIMATHAGRETVELFPKLPNSVQRNLGALIRELAAGPQS